MTSTHSPATSPDDQPADSSSLPAVDVSYRTLANALRAVIQQPELEEQLMRTDTADVAAARLGLDNDTRRALLNVLRDLGGTGHRPAPGHDVPLTPSPRQTLPSGQADVNRAREFMDESWDQLRRAYNTSVRMSLVVFVIGIGFLLLAAYQTLRGSVDATTVAVIGGVGVAQIVALFYRNPLAQIAHALANAQQARIAITSYLMAVSLIADQVTAVDTPEERHIQMLTDLTGRTLGWLGRDNAAGGTAPTAPET